MTLSVTTKLEPWRGVADETLLSTIETGDAANAEPMKSAVSRTYIIIFEFTICSTPEFELSETILTPYSCVPEADCCEQIVH